MQGSVISHKKRSNVIAISPRTILHFVEWLDMRTWEKEINIEFSLFSFNTN